MSYFDYSDRFDEVFPPLKNTKKKEQKKILTNNKKETKKKGKKTMYNMHDNNSYMYPKANLLVDQSALLTGDDVVNISLSDSKRNRGYIFYMQKDLQAIYEKSGPHAYDNEFQVHYWFLNFRYKAEDGSIIDIAVPTCYFNYEQFVTSGHVDFELKDVGPVSEKVMPLHNMKTNELLALEIDKKINNVFDGKLQFEAVSVNFGTMHRHPGQSTSQNFSPTDLNINVKTEKDALGVVFPLADAEDDKPSFSAIIALDGAAGYYNQKGVKKTANLAHCEYRNANGKIQTGLHYEKNRCIAFNVIPKEEPSIVEQLFGIKPIRKSIAKFNNTESTLFNKEEELLEIFEEIEKVWEASTHCVIADNVKLPVTTQSVKVAGQVHFTYANSKKEIEESSFNKNDSEEKETEKKQFSTHDKYLLAKTTLAKINASTNFINTVKKHIIIENEENYVGSLPVTVKILESILNDYNTMSSLFYGKAHRDEEIRFYTMNGHADYRDIRDFLNENINIAMAIVEETHCNIQTIKDYENSDSTVFKSINLYKNPFNDIDTEEKTANTPEEAEALKKDEAYDAMADAEAAKKKADEYVKENDTVALEPESSVVDTLLGAVTKFMKG